MTGYVMALGAWLLAATTAASAKAASIESVYTDIAEASCITVDKAGADDGDWSTSVCAGFMGYPVVIDYSDARDSVFYGFSPFPGKQWESFDGFNSAGKKIEWRLLKDGEKTIPFATISRWSVADPEDSEQNIEVLVVAKVGQINKREGCVVGLVRASGNPDANELARKIADEQVDQFSCGDEKSIVGEPMPTMTRTTE